MPEPIIKVTNLSKRYRIGLKEEMNDSIGGAIVAAVKSPFRNFRRLNELSKFKGDDEKDVFWALRDVSFELHEGEVLGIIGKNGAGKSTLLKLLTRITPPTQGKINIKGRVASLLEVGTGFHNELTGRENIYLNGTILGMKKKEIDARFDEIVSFSGVEKFIDTPVKRYSSGMTVRLAFAVAAHLEPEILIIDEVLAVGDSDFQKKCLGKVGDMSRHGRTVLFVSHNMAAVKSLCTKCIYLQNGQLKELGDPVRIVNHYLMRGGSNLFLEIDPDESEYRNEFVRVESIETITELYEGKISIKEQLSIKVVAVNKTNEPYPVNVNIFFNSDEGECIFVALSGINEVPPGRFEAVCIVPADFLNDVGYVVDVMVVRNGEEPLVHIRNAIVFEAAEPPRETGWMGVMPGLIRPKMEWKFNFEKQIA